MANFIEPFAGSAAMLLGRPDPPKIETLNDVDGDFTNALRAVDPMIGRPDDVADAACEVMNDFDPFVVNAWRSLKEAPGDTADWASQQVNELNLHAMHKWLVLGEHSREFVDRMRSDPEYFDPRRAGYWIAGICCWIGSGWCSRPEWEGRGSAIRTSAGINAALPAERPILAGAADGHGGRSHEGQGVHAKGPSEKMPRAPRPNGSGTRGNSQGVHAEHGPSAAHRPQLADAYSRGRGVHADPPGMGLSEKRPILSGGGPADGIGNRLGNGVHARGPTDGTCEARRAWLRGWFGRLRDRLRTVRVCCGDWKRVCDSPSVTTRLGLTGIFADPPYCHDLDRMHAWVAHLRGGGPEPKPKGKATSRSADLYSTDGGDVDRLVAEVHLYCAGRGDDPMMRLALSGYAGEHEPLEALGWTAVAWRAGGGYANRNKNGNVNRDREIIWFSPACIDPERDDRPLFAGLEDSPC